MPDLGADLIRTYSATSASKGITELNAFHTSPGVGPRHGVFSPSGEYYYQLTELSNHIEVFSVLYTPNIALTRVQSISVYPTGISTTLVSNAFASGIAIASDGRFLYTSNRNDSFTDAHIAPPPSTQTELSDSISTFSVEADGRLVFLERAPVGGKTPRHFSLDPRQDGGYVAVATQTTGRVTIYIRNRHSGKLATVPVASIDLTASGVTKPVCVTWLD